MTPPNRKLRNRHIDILLLSIIRAYSHPARKSEGERLAVAREAIFGEKRGRGRTASTDDLALFKINAEVRKRDIDGLRLALAKHDQLCERSEREAESARAPMTVREAVRAFSALAGRSGAVESSIYDRLRRKARTSLSARDMAELESLLDTDDPRTRTIIAILDFLEDLGVSSEKIWDENT